MCVGLGDEMIGITAIGARIISIEVMHGSDGFYASVYGVTTQAVIIISGIAALPSTMQ